MWRSFYKLYKSKIGFNFLSLSKQILIKRAAEGREGTKSQTVNVTFHTAIKQ